MGEFDTILADLIAANRILAAEGVVDAFGHVSVRHPGKPGRFLLSRARPPELIVAADIMEFTTSGEPVDGDTRKPYLERFIHGALYEARADVNAIVHSHSRSVVPFSVNGEAIRPIAHSCAIIGHAVPVWDSRTRFGDTDLLISNMDMGRDFAASMGDRRCALMRGHGSVVVGGSIREAVYAAVYLEVNADLQARAGHSETISFLSAGEIDTIITRLKRGRPGEGYDRAWEYWCLHAGQDFVPANA